MKKYSNQEVHLFQYLKKLFLRYKITILIIVFGISNILITTASDLSNAGITNIPSGIEVQQVTVSGTVTDASNGTAMPGVNVVVRNTNFGTLTDMNGRFTLAVPDQNSVLVFSFIGYNSVEQPVSGKTVVNVTLSATTQALDEVIVIGYGTQKKSDLTGSVVRVSLEEKSSLANTNLSQALSGASAGVNVQGTGLAGSEPNLSIRGQTSLSQ